MAFEIATATGFDDLCDRIYNFLTANAALVGAGQQWVSPGAAGPAWAAVGVAPGVNTHRALRAPGAGTDVNLHCYLTKRSNPSTPYYNLGISASGGFEAGQLPFDQPNPSSYRHWITCWDAPMPYWIVADNRFMKLMVKVGATCQTMCFGLLLPNGTPTEIPYVVYVGAVRAVAGETGLTSNHNSSTYDFASFFDPSGYAEYRHPSGVWAPVRNHYESSGSYQADTSSSSIWPWTGSTSDLNTIATLRECFDNGGPGGEYPLFQAALISSYAGNNIIGYLPGVFWIPGFSQTFENTLTIAGGNYVVAQSHVHSHRNAFAAFKLE